MMNNLLDILKDVDAELNSLKKRVIDLENAQSKQSHKFTLELETDIITLKGQIDEIKKYLSKVGSEGF